MLVTPVKEVLRSRDGPHKLLPEEDVPGMEYITCTIFAGAPKGSQPKTERFASYVILILIETEVFFSSS